MKDHKVQKTTTVIIAKNIINIIITITIIINIRIVMKISKAREAIIIISIVTTKIKKMNNWFKQ